MNQNLNLNVTDRAAMAGQGGEKLKINHSYVHEEYDIVKNYYHPTKHVFGEGRKCKICNFVMAGKNTTNLKSHLKQHDDAYQRVISRFSTSSLN